MLDGPDRSIPTQNHLEDEKEECLPEKGGEDGHQKVPSPWLLSFPAQFNSSTNKQLVNLYSLPYAARKPSLQIPPTTSLLVLL